MSDFRVNFVRGKNIRGRHLFFSVANWKNRPESFYHLRVVNRHQVFFWLSFDTREGQMQNWFFPYGPSNMEKQAPGSDLIPAQCLPFYISPPKFPFQFLRITRLNFSQTDTWRAVAVPTQFHPSSSAVPAVAAGVTVGVTIGLGIWFGWKESRWKCGGTAVEPEELGWNRNRTRVPVSPCPQHPSTHFSFWPNPPQGQESPHRMSTLNDLPK